MVARVRVALAEMGYGHLTIMEVGPDPAGIPQIGWVGTRDELPPAIAWTAGWLARPMPCWSCWLYCRGSWKSNALADACQQGHCANPDGPARPPRELLVAKK
jgi:hypothetical protein